MRFLSVCWIELSKSHRRARSVGERSRLEPAPATLEASTCRCRRRRSLPGCRGPRRTERGWPTRCSRDAPDQCAGRPLDVTCLLCAASSAASRLSAARPVGTQRAILGARGRTPRSEPTSTILRLVSSAWRRSCVPQTRRRSDGAVSSLSSADEGDDSAPLIPARLYLRARLCGKHAARERMHLPTGTECPGLPNRERPRSPVQPGGAGQPRASADVHVDNDVTTSDRPHTDAC